MTINFNREKYHPTPLLKAVQVFLLILIVLGIGLIITQKMWVPSVVTYILKDEIGASPTTEKIETTEVTETSETIVGGDRDTHGCIGSAGYSWCDARQTCERPWEQYCTATPPKVALFTCDEGKTIRATFYPSDDAYVDLVLSDERALSIPRAISASGARYAKEDESFVFWNKGNTAFVTENETTTYAGCVTEVE